MSGQAFRRRGDITAVQWFQIGDHPGVFRRENWPEPRDGCWRYWIGRPDAGYVVEPGDWICTDERGHSWPLHPDEFAKRYEPLPTNAAETRG